MSQPEGRLSSKILAEINSLPHTFAWKVWGNEVQMAGLPDIVGVSHGIFFGVETKMPGLRDRLRPSQRLVHARIAAAMGNVRVCCSVQEARSFVEGLEIVPLTSGGAIDR